MFKDNAKLTQTAKIVKSIAFNKNKDNKKKLFPRRKSSESPYSIMLDGNKQTKHDVSQCF